MHKQHVQVIPPTPPELQDEFRAALYYRTTDVPTSPSHRAQQVANDFATRFLQRPFSWDTDHIHFGEGFDSEIPKWVWIVCDFNLTRRIAEVDCIPMTCWEVRCPPAHATGRCDSHENY
jgi:hypothetical protein